MIYHQDFGRKHGRMSCTTAGVQSLRDPVTSWSCNNRVAINRKAAAYPQYCTEIAAEATNSKAAPRSHHRQLHLPVTLDRLVGASTRLHWLELENILEVELRVQNVHNSAGPTQTRPMQSFK